MLFCLFFRGVWNGNQSLEKLSMCSNSLMTVLICVHISLWWSVVSSKMGFYRISYIGWWQATFTIKLTTSRLISNTGETCYAKTYLGTAWTAATLKEWRNMRLNHSKILEYLWRLIPIVQHVLSVDRSLDYQTDTKHEHTKHKLARIYFCKYIKYSQKLFNIKVLNI